MNSTLSALYGLGDGVRHTQADIRGVVVDVDFSPSDAGGQPHYRVLVDHPTDRFIAYAPESQLKAEPEAARGVGRHTEAFLRLDADGRLWPRSQPTH